jgi:hypothetical protein
MGSQYYEYAGRPDGQTARTARTARTAWNNKLLLAKDIAFRVALLITFCVARSLNDLDVLRQEMSRVHFGRCRCSELWRSPHVDLAQIWQYFLMIPMMTSSLPGRLDMVNFV